MHVWTKDTIAMRGGLNGCALVVWGVLAAAVLFFCLAAMLTACSGGQCRYDARFDGREPDPDNGVYPYYLVAECPGEVTQTLVESATRLHVPR